MKVYVETNFVMELVFGQEQSTSCNDIIRFCEQGHAQLAIPAYCLAEPHEKLIRESRRRAELQDSLNAELKQLTRSSFHARRIEQLEDIRALLVQSSEVEGQRFASILPEIIAVSQVIPLTAAILTTAVQYEDSRGLGPQDAVVYASILSDLQDRRPHQACFLNRNSRDFNGPNIVSELARFDCRSIWRFDHGLEFIKSQIQEVI